MERVFLYFMTERQFYGYDEFDRDAAVSLGAGLVCVNPVLFPGIVF